MRRGGRLRLLAAVFLALAGPAWGAPGELLAADPIEPAPPGAKAWRIRYETTAPSGAPTESTGVVVAPTGGAAPREVLAWAHGTVGVAPACAPSLRSPFGLIPALTAMLAQGWMLVATDYPGLGTPGPHRYLDGEATARAVIDSARAARALGAGTQFAVWGHSQGGQAALWAGQIARSYAPELDLVGVAAAAPPTDLVADWAAMNPAKRAGLTAFLGLSWSAVYGLPLSDLGDPRTQAAVREAGSACAGQPPTARSKLAAARVRARLRTVDLWMLPRWRAIMEADSADPSEVGTPVLVTQGLADDIIAPEVIRRFVAEACRRGAPVRLITHPGSHGAGVSEGEAATLAWLADRFGGRAAPSDC